MLPHSLFIWLTAPPVDIRSKGGFKESKTDLVKVREVQMFNAIARRVFSQAAYNYNMFVVVDLETYFDGVTFDRKDDGVHWNARAHRHITNLIMEQIANAPRNETHDTYSSKDMLRYVEKCDFNNTVLTRGVKRSAEKENTSPYSHLLKRRKLNNATNMTEFHEKTNKGKESTGIFPLIDCAVNLTNVKLIHDADAVVARALSSGVKKMVVTCYKLSHMNQMFNLLKNNPGVLFAAVGVHPYFVEEEWKAHSMDRMEKLLTNKHTVAVGECGLDYYNPLSPPHVQRGAFEEHIQLAVRYNKPLLVHERDAHRDVLSILHNFPSLPPVVIHCFTGTICEARRYVEEGYYIGVTGFVCKEGAQLRQAITSRCIPLNRIILQSNSPYMAPCGTSEDVACIPLLKHCGKGNEPWKLSIVVLSISKCLGMTPRDVSKQLALNAQKVFHISF